jgi:hypothetical protein
MVKFKIGFTIPAETLFGMIAKMLPIEDLQVEELMEQKQPKVDQSRIAKLIAAMPEKKEKKPHKNHIPFRHPSGRTLTDFVSEFMEKNKGDIAWADLSRFTESLGFAKSSINNAVARLLEKGTIEKRGPGVYGIKKKVISTQK